MSVEVVRLAENVVLAALLVTIMYTDWRFLRIPNAFTYPAMLVGIVSVCMLKLMTVMGVQL